MDHKGLQALTDDIEHVEKIYHFYFIVIHSILIVTNLIFI